MDLSWLWPIVKWILSLAAVFAVLWGQWYLRLRLLHRWLRQGNANEQALRRWRELKFLCRLMKRPVPQELEELALKAKFSQYTLEKQELHRFHHYRTDILTAMKAGPWYRQILYRLVLAVY